MKIQAILVSACLVSCSLQMGDDAEAKFRIKKKLSHYHAQYRFTHADYEDVDVAVRIEVKGNKPSMLEVKDLNANDPVESVTLTASGDDFVGTSSGDIGGTYTVKLASGACCGNINFVPTADTSATFVGTKSKDLTDAEWKTLIAPKEYFHAQYKFTHADYDDVDVAVRIEVKDNKPSILEVKDLNANDPVESVTLTASGDDFVGTSSGDIGGTYTVKLASGACCGNINFVPTADTSTTFVGTKSKDLTAAEWKTLSEQTDASSTSESEQKFYTVKTRKMLLSRTAFDREPSKQYKYLLQAVVGKNSDGSHKQPLVHIKQVNDDGSITADCLSLLYDEKQDNNDDGFKFRLMLPSQDTYPYLEFLYGSYDLKTDSQEHIFTISQQTQTRSHGYGSHFLFIKEASLIPEASVATKKSEWGISDDIVAAFGSGSSCDAQGHNRTCTGCLMQ